MLKCFIWERVWYEEVKMLIDWVYEDRMNIVEEYKLNVYRFWWDYFINVNVKYWDIIECVSVEF